MGRPRRTAVRQDAIAPPDPLQLILDRLDQQREALDQRLDQQQETMEQRLDQQQQAVNEIRATQARQEQDRDAAIAAAVAAALADRQPPVQEPVQEPAQEPVEAAIPEQVPVHPPQQVLAVNNQESLQQWMTQFCKYHPPSFEGSYEVHEAEEWVMQLEKIFHILQCPSEAKAQMAIYKLQKEAYRWWKNTEIILRARNTPITWEVFLQQFDEKYFPQSVRTKKEAEFLTLRQGDNESFDDYLDTFTRLSRYSSYLRRMDDEVWMADMLIRGLRQEIQDRLLPKQYKTFNKAVEACRIVAYRSEHAGKAKVTPKAVPKVDGTPEKLPDQRREQSRGYRSNNNNDRKRKRDHWDSKYSKRDKRPGGSRNQQGP